MGDFKDLMRRVHALEKSHSKEVLKEKQKQILKLYEGLLEELDELVKKEIVNITIESHEIDVTIMIVSSEAIAVTEYDIFFNTLIITSDRKSIKVDSGTIIIELWFRCWEYRNREEQIILH